MNKRKPLKPRHERAAIRYSFADEPDISLQLVDVTSQALIQYARMAESDNPASRAEGRKMIRRIAEFCVAGQFSLDDQGKRSKKPRGTIETDEGRTSRAAIIRELAHQKDQLGDYLKSKELRPLFCAKLDELGLSPREDKQGVTFEDELGTKRITWDAFRSTISRERRENKSET